MATITGYTAARMKDIEDNTVVDGTINGEGHLILVKRNTAEIDTGIVQGPQGNPGPKGDPGTDGADADFGGYVEPFNDRGNVSGTVNLDFALYNVWRINPTGAVTITFSNLPTSANVAPGTLIVANSAYAITWPAATKFPGGDPPILSGETFLSMLARSTHVTVGAAWDKVAI